jgi:NAD(P)-dependent dehydrogenase (short-subunit alcohol dehydrogenase family)
VIATTRSVDPSKAQDLLDLKAQHDAQLRIELCHVTDSQAVTNLFKRLDTSIPALDIVINNAGIALEEDVPFHDVSVAAIRESFEVNTIAPIHVAQSAASLLRRSRAPILINMSTRLASIQNVALTNKLSTPYRLSKVALNMFTKCLSLEWPHAICIALHPGYIHTYCHTLLACVNQHARFVMINVWVMYISMMLWSHIPLPALFLLCGNTCGH